jgi:hypothetical protein
VSRVRSLTFKICLEEVDNKLAIGPHYPTASVGWLCFFCSPENWLIQYKNNIDDIFRPLQVRQKGTFSLHMSP